MKDLKNWFNIYEQKRPTLFDKAIIELGKEIKKRRRILKKEFIEIMSWKLGNMNYAQYFSKNYQQDIDNYIKLDFFEEMFNDSKTIERIELLCNLFMINVSVASAFLAIIFPNHYGVIDRYSLRALEMEKLFGDKKKDIRLYLKYLQRIRSLAKQLSLTPKEVDSTLMTKGLFLDNKENIKIKNKLPDSYQDFENIQRKRLVIKFTF